MNALSASGLADLAGVTAAEVQRLLVDPALLAIYHRQEELVWTEGLVERIESELEAAGVLGRPGRVPAMSFLDLTGYTRLTEERGRPCRRRAGAGQRERGGVGLTRGRELRGVGGTAVGGVCRSGAAAGSPPEVAWDARFASVASPNAADRARRHGPRPRTTYDLPVSGYGKMQACQQP